jgi:hypothetical protein
MPSYPRKSSFSQNGCITADEYDYHTTTSIKKIVSQPPTDHSQRTGKLLPYIASMVSIAWIWHGQPCSYFLV